MRRLFLAGALLAAMLLPASSAMAAPYQPTGAFASFNNCPLSKSTLKACFYSKISSGFVTTGKKTVPIKNPVVLQGGLEYPESIFENVTFLGAEDGNTLTKTPQPVPGGLLGIQAPSWWPSILRNLFNETINNGFTGVTATMELAGPPSAIKLDVLATATGQGTALHMPVKIKLGNPFLGNNCYIGSNSQPITLKLTTGTTSPPPPNTPISGSPGEGQETENGDLLTISKNKLVDNSFAVPGANGCGGILFSWAVDPFVNSIVGIPSPAGSNTAVLEGEIKIGNPAAVKASMP
jgi:hypothetical protein